MGDFFGGGSRRSSNGPMKGANLRTSVRITFEEAIFGCEKEIELVLKDECKTCDGTGAKPGTTPENLFQMRRKRKSGIFPAVTVWHGSECSGNVRTAGVPERLSVRSVRTAGVPVMFPPERGLRLIFRRVLIMARVSGSAIRVEPGVNGGPRGDLLWRLLYLRHPVFQERGYEYLSTAPISYAQAVLGGETRISTVDGEVIYEVKPGTQTDTRIRLKGKGVPSLRNKNYRGDHYVTLVVQVPTNLTAEAK